MTQEYSLAEITSAIEDTARKLFSAGLLSEHMQLASSLAALRGLDLYPTEVPWRITLPQATPIIGLSETLRLAAKDIHSHLITLTKTLPSDTKLIIEVDTVRLPKKRNTAIDRGI